MGRKIVNSSLLHATVRGLAAKTRADTSRDLYNGSAADLIFAFSCGSVNLYTLVYELRLISHEPNQIIGETPLVT